MRTDTGMPTCEKYLNCSHITQTTSLRKGETVLVGQPPLQVGCYISITALCTTPLHKVRRTTPKYKREKPTDHPPNTRTDTTAILAEFP